MQTQTKLKKESGLKKEFEVVIPAKDIAKERQAQIVQYSKKAKMPGFREGKVPAAMIEKRYGDSIKADVLDKLIRESADKLFKDKKLVPCMEPDIKPEKFEELARAKVLGATRQAPALLKGKLYLRDDNEIVCVDISGAK